MTVWQRRLALFLPWLLCWGVFAEACAESFRIQSRPDDGWPIEVQGSAVLQRRAAGVLISFDELIIRARYTDNEPLFIAALKFDGNDRTDGSGRRTALMFSERLPVGQALIAGTPIVLRNTAPIFMKQPGWHQNDARFDLIVEIRVNGGDGFIPVATNLHELKLASDFSRREVADIREDDRRVSIADALSFLIAAAGYVAFLRWCGLPGRTALFGFLPFVFVWAVGFYPMLRLTYSFFWPEVSAQIVDAGVRTRPPGRREARFRSYPVVKYQYDVAGRRFVSTQVDLAQPPSFDSVFEAHDALKTWDEKRARGEPVRAWVNPLDRTDAVLLRRVNAAGALSSMAGIAALVTLALRRKTA